MEEINGIPKNIIRQFPTNVEVEVYNPEFVGALCFEYKRLKQENENLQNAIAKYLLKDGEL